MTHTEEYNAGRSKHNLAVETAESFGYADGREWFVSHDVMEIRP